jgi:iron complex outermembrane receptor protein
MPTVVPALLPKVPTATEVDTDSYGLYGQATWNPDILDDRLKITLGLRYGKDEKDAARTVESGVRLVPAREATATSERVDPALTIAWQLLDDTSIYARYSTAYRGGGVSVREIYTFTPYEEEEVEASEIGIKSVFWDNRARINVAAFYNEIDNFLITAQQIDCGPGVNCSTANTVGVNASGKARTSGVELDSSVLLTDGLTFSLAYTYLDSSVPSVAGAASVQNLALNNAPRNGWSVGLDYAFEPFSFGSLNAHVDAARSDPYCFNANSCEPNPALQMPAVLGGDVTLINARLTLSDIGLGAFGSMTAALWGKNLTDEEYFNFGYPAPSNALLGNTTVRQYGEPRSVGVTLTYQY